MKKDIMKSIAMITQIGIAMIVPIILCVWIGKYLDEVFDTGALFLIIFIILGAGSSFRTLYMMTVHKYKKEAEKEKERRDYLKGRYCVGENAEDNKSKRK